jgi:ubiquinone/menaquinone biosynthesis C-methylase UbiE
VKAPFRHRFWRWFYDCTAFANDYILHLADRLHLGSEERIRRQVLAALPVAAGAAVLDLGCGTAGSRPSLPADIRYPGVDSSRTRLLRARTKSASHGWPFHLVQADALALPLRAVSIDLIIAMGVLQHLSHVGMAAGEALRVAKPGARLLLVDERQAQARVLSAFQHRDTELKLINE